MTQSSKGPLSGITVIDLSRILAGPYCTHLMAEMGARVIKVEQPKGGDDARAYGPFVKGKSTYFASVNRGKQSIALDLKGEKDRAIFEKLLAKADVIVENFRPGTMEKLGYGWEQLHAKYPKLIYASASGFGHTGPNSRDPAYDMVVQGMGGIMSVTGDPSTPPVKIGVAATDIITGIYATTGILAALHHRHATGRVVAGGLSVAPESAGRGRAARDPHCVGQVDVVAEHDPELHDCEQNEEHEGQHDRRFDHHLSVLVSDSAPFAHHRQLRDRQRPQAQPVCLIRRLSRFPPSPRREPSNCRRRCAEGARDRVTKRPDGGNGADRDHCHDDRVLGERLPLLAAQRSERDPRPTQEAPKQPHGQAALPRV